MTTFVSYSHFPEQVRAALLELEVFIGDLDGQEADGGTIDADDAVKAFNVVVAAIPLLSFTEQDDGPYTTKPERPSTAEEFAHVARLLRECTNPRDRRIHLGVGFNIIVEALEKAASAAPECRAGEREEIREAICQKIICNGSPTPGTCTCCSRAADAVLALSASPRSAEGWKARPASEYHEDMGPVLWWNFPINEPPYVGGPNDLGQTVEVTVRAHGVDKMMRVSVGGWPGDYTHFTPIICPAAPFVAEPGERT